MRLCCSASTRGVDADEAAGEPAREGIPPLIKTLTSKYSAWRRFRESVRELSRLSDRELSDLGIGRSDIVTVVKQSLVQG